MPRFRANASENTALWQFGIIWLIRPEDIISGTVTLHGTSTWNMHPGPDIRFSFHECLSWHSIRMATTGAYGLPCVPVVLVFKAFMGI